MSLNVLQFYRYRNYYKQIEPLFKSRKNQAYTMVSLSLITIAFFGIFAIKPTVTTITNLQKQIQDKNEVNKQLDQKINSLIKAQEEYEKKQGYLPIIYSLLPDKPEFPMLLRLIEQLTIDQNATISAIQFSPINLYTQGSQPPVSIKPAAEATDSAFTQAIARNTAIQTIPKITLTPVVFTLTLGGGYENLLAILSNLTKMERLITVNSVTLSGSGNQSTLTVNIQSDSYYYALKY